MGTPAMYTPFTKAQASWFSNQGKRCGDLEMDYYRCASRVGLNRSHFDCYKEYNDYLECMFRTKQFARYCAMQDERKKQNRPFPPTPHPDGVSIL
ncbi:NADH dehydrogenase [ubiquinone] iron-sulfur protein 5-like [Babylonia areolata]|uniref:NADH dehydrogenase [ubiquinone] iron-sulfur protein 5-like n=1 Tax=Babylonia areolata TaxID=304850 RepID=UPI003FD0C643